MTTRPAPAIPAKPVAWLYDAEPIGWSARKVSINRQPTKVEAGWSETPLYTCTPVNDDWADELYERATDAFASEQSPASVISRAVAEREAGMVAEIAKLSNIVW